MSGSGSSAEAPEMDEMDRLMDLAVLPPPAGCQGEGGQEGRWQDPGAWAVVGLVLDAWRAVPLSP